MTTLGLLAEPLMRAEVVNRRHPPTPLRVLITERLRRISVALLETAEAILAPDHENGAASAGTDRRHDHAPTRRT